MALDGAGATPLASLEATLTRLRARTHDARAKAPITSTLTLPTPALHTMHHRVGGPGSATPAVGATPASSGSAMLTPPPRGLHHRSHDPTLDSESGASPPPPPSAHVTPFPHDHGGRRAWHAPGAVEASQRQSRLQQLLSTLADAPGHVRGAPVLRDGRAGVNHDATTTAMRSRSGSDGVGEVDRGAVGASHHHTSRLTPDRVHARHDTEPGVASVQDGADDPLPSRLDALGETVADVISQLAGVAGWVRAAAGHGTGGGDGAGGTPFSSAVVRHSGGASTLESASFTLASIVLPGLDEVKQGVHAVLSHAAAQHSQAWRQIMQLRNEVQVVRAEVSSAWVGKWQTREAQWQEIVADLRRRLVEQEHGREEGKDAAAATIAKLQGDVHDLERQVATLRAENVELAHVAEERGEQVATLQAAGVRGSMANAFAHVPPHTPTVGGASTSALPSARAGRDAGDQGAPSPPPTSIIVATAKLAAVQRQLADTNAELESAHATLAGFKHVATDLQTEVEVLRGERSRLESLVASKTVLIEGLEARVKEANDAIAALRSEVAMEHRRVMSMMEEVKRAREVADSASREGLGLKVAMLQAMRQLDSAIATVSGMPPPDPAAHGQGGGGGTPDAVDPAALAARVSTLVSAATTQHSADQMVLADRQAAAAAMHDTLSAEVRRLRGVVATLTKAADDAAVDGILIEFERRSAAIGHGGTTSSVAADSNPSGASSMWLAAPQRDMADASHALTSSTLTTRNLASTTTAASTGPSSPPATRPPTRFELDGRPTGATASTPLPSSTTGVGLEARTSPRDSAGRLALSSVSRSGDDEVHAAVGLTAPPNPLSSPSRLAGGGGGGSTTLRPAIITPAHVAGEVARARAEERATVLREMTVARRVMGGDGISVEATALVAAHAGAAAAERENARLQGELSKLAQLWQRERLGLDAAMAGLEARLHQVQDEVAVAAARYRAAEAEAAALRSANAELRSSSGADADAMREAIAHVQGEATTLRAELAAARHEHAAAEAAHARAMKAAAEAAAVRAAAEARGDAMQAQAVAVKAAVEAAVERERHAADDRMRSMETSSKGAVAAEVSRAQREWEAASQLRLAELARAHDAALREAVSSARAEEARVAEANLAAAQHRFDAQMASMAARVAHYRAVAQREVTRRRQIHGKVMDLQGNIRVHLRIRPTAAQLASLLKAGAAGWMNDDETPSPSGGGGMGWGDGAEAAAAMGGMDGDAVLTRGKAHDGVAGCGDVGAVESLGQGQCVVRAPWGVAVGDAVMDSPPGSAGQAILRRTLEYEFDEVHGPGTSQQEVWEHVRPMVDVALDGVNVTVMTYGQTGSGKTYSLEGEGQGGRAGITIRTVRHLFTAAPERAAQRRHAGTSGVGGGGDDGYTIAISMFEVYQERVCDLLAGVTVDAGGSGVVRKGPLPTSSTSSGTLTPTLLRPGSATRDGLVGSGGAGGSDTRWSRGLRWAGASSGAGVDEGVDSDNLTLREGTGGVEIVGLTRLTVSDARTALEAIRIGTSTRSVGSHALNDRSSRSHMVVRLWVTGPGPSFTRSRVTSLIQLVDLAGSERVRRTGAEGEGMKEAQAINGSLSTLGTVVYGLKRGQSHVPYRDSKLTFVLKDSMCGGSKVLLLACVSAEEADVPESVCTLTFAQRCRATALGAPVRNLAKIPSSRSLPAPGIRGLDDVDDAEVGGVGVGKEADAPHLSERGGVPVPGATTTAPSTPARVTAAGSFSRLGGPSTRPSGRPPSTVGGGAHRRSVSVGPASTSGSAHTSTPLRSNSFKR